MTLSRRGMLNLGLAGLGASLLPGVASARSAVGDWPAAVQMWAVNEQLKADFEGTLKGLKSAGYDSVETAGLHGRTPMAFRQAVEAQGLKIISAHVSMTDLIADPDRRIEEVAATGAKWLFASAPKPLSPLPSGDWVSGMITAMTRDAWVYNAEQIARITPKAIAAGLVFGYHNHPMEFTAHGGQNGLDMLLKADERLRLQLDIGWVAASGNDPVVIMNRYASRIELLHVKDMVRDPAFGAGYKSVDVGTGVVDWKAIFKRARELRLKGYVIDQEPPFPSAPLTSLANSLAYLRGL